MGRAPHLLAMASAASALIAAGCDPGHTYYPLDRYGLEADTTAEVIDGVEFRVNRSLRLEGDTIHAAQLKVTNNSKNDVSVLNAQMQPNRGRAIEATRPKTPEQKKTHCWTVPAGKSGVVHASWDFPSSQRRLDATGQRFTLVWNVRIGTKEHVLRIRMEKD